MQQNKTGHSPLNSLKSYADDYPGNIYEYVWDQFFKIVEPTSANVPYMVKITTYTHTYKASKLSMVYNKN